MVTISPTVVITVLTGVYVVYVHMLVVGGRNYAVVIMSRPTVSLMSSSRRLTVMQSFDLFSVP